MFGEDAGVINQDFDSFEGLDRIVPSFVYSSLRREVGSDHHMSVPGESGANFFSELPFTVAVDRDTAPPGRKRPCDGSSYAA